MTAPAAVLPAAGAKVAITVTADHIARGARCIAGECAIALAITDAFPGAGEVTAWQYLDGGELMPVARLWTGPASWIFLRFGRDAREFMDAFDDGEPVGPAVLEAEVAA